ncbi:MAG: MotE family protein, partial [Rickettsiales bacterium]
AKRREKLDSWEKEIALREKVLEATETRIDGKIAEMQKLSDDIKKLLVAYNDEEDTKLRSLVKIYESMKPKQAAPIFEKMDMQILLMVVDRMSERRVAPILAQMSPSRAKEVTEQLAEERLKRPQLSPELIEE